MKEAHSHQETLHALDNQLRLLDNQYPALLNHLLAAIKASRASLAGLPYEERLGRGNKPATESLVTVLSGLSKQERNHLQDQFQIFLEDRRPQLWQTIMQIVNVYHELFAGPTTKSHDAEQLKKDYYYTMLNITLAAFKQFNPYFRIQDIHQPYHSDSLDWG